MSLRVFPKEKVLITMPNHQLRVIDGLVSRGVAPTRSALLQQIIGAFVSEANRMRNVTPTPYSQPQTIGNALEALIAYFLYSLGKVAIDEVFGEK